MPSLRRKTDWMRSAWLGSVPLLECAWDVRRTFGRVAGRFRSTPDALVQARDASGLHAECMAMFSASPRVRMGRQTHVRTRRRPIPVHAGEVPGLRREAVRTVHDCPDERRRLLPVDPSAKNRLRRGDDGIRAGLSCKIRTNACTAETT